MAGYDCVRVVSNFRNSLLVDSDEDKDTCGDGTERNRPTQKCGTAATPNFNRSCSRLRSGRLSLFDTWRWNVSRVNGLNRSLLEHWDFPVFPIFGELVFGCLDQRERFLAGFTS